MGYRIIQKGDKYILYDGTKALASARIRKNGDTINLKAWRAYVKGKGHGKRLLRMFMKKNPKIWYIATDGFTQAGAKNIEKALKNFKIIEWRYGTGGIGFLMRQDAIDYYIDQNKAGKRTLFYLNPSLHSQYRRQKLHTRTSKTGKLFYAGGKN